MTVCISYGQDYRSDTLWLSGNMVYSKNDGDACYYIAPDFSLVRVPLSGKGPVKSAVKDISGNISYEFLYRSQVDTPFAQQDFRRHIIRGRVNTKVINNIPVSVNWAYRTDNSPYYRNTLDLSVDYDRQRYNKDLKQQYLERYKNKLFESKGMLKLEQDYRTQMNDVTYWQKMTGNADYNMLQRKEADVLINKMYGALKDKLGPDINLNESYTKRELFEMVKGKLPATSIDNIIDKGIIQNRLDSSGGKYKDSLQAKFANVMSQYQDQVGEYNRIKNMVDSSRQKAKGLYDTMQLYRRQLTDSLNKFKAELDNVKNGAGYARLAEKAGLNKDSLPGLKTGFWHLEDFKIGRHTVDYTELTVRGLSVTGAGVTLADKLYIQASAGFSDNRYRDIVLRQRRLPRQPAAMVRVGLSGYADRGLFFTVYHGKREVLTANPDNRSMFGLSGYSLQYLYPIGWGSFGAEFAKSTGGSYRPGANGNIEKEAGLFSLALRSNEAFLLKFNGTVPQTQTGIKAEYQRNGPDFQSLARYTYNATQSSYLLEASQPLFKQVINIKAGIRKNNFEYDGIENLSGNNVLKTAQISFRKAKYPTVFAGYYPSSQLMLTPDSNIFRINFQTFTGTVAHNYRFKKIWMNSMVVYSRFYNSSTDTGFLFYNATSLMLQQTVHLGRFSLQGGYTNSMQSSSHLQTGEFTLTHNGVKGLTIEAGGKYNVISGKSEDKILGYHGRLSYTYKKLGTIMLSYDNSVLPVWGQERLMPVSTGNLKLIRQF